MTYPWPALPTAPVAADDDGRDYRRALRWTLWVVGAPVGVVLGIRALRRHQAPADRWQATAATWLGALLTVALIGTSAIGYAVSRHLLRTGDLHPGQCVDLRLTGGEPGITRASCARHDAEAVAVGTFTSTSLAAYRKDANAARFCERAMSADAHAVAMSELYTLTVLVGERTVGDIEVGTSWACLLRRADGTALTGRVITESER